MRGKPTAVLVLIVAALAGMGPLSEALAKDHTPGPPLKADANSSAKSGGGHHEGGSAVKLVGWLEISGPLRDAPPPMAFLGADASGKASVRHIIDKIHMVGDDNQYLGLVIHLDQAELEMAQIDEISQAIRDLRSKGKKVLVFSEDYDRKSYLLACAADRIVLQHKGLLELEGLGVEEMYLAGLLEKIGAKADFLQMGKYKGAEEPLTRTGPSPEWSQNFDGLLDDLWDQTLATIGKARHLSREEVEKALGDCWSMSDSQYVDRHLVDDLADRDLIDVTEHQFGSDFDWEDMETPAEATHNMDNPFALLQLLFKEPQTNATRPSLALIHASGEIISGDGGDGGSMFSSESIGSRSMVEALGDAENDDLVKGVVVRIDSPGGSALASEIIWQAVHELAQSKPVYISVGPMAASGGYYIACAGDKIYVSDASIVGSIGVVGGKIILGGLYDKIGVSVYRRSRGPLGDMFNSVEEFTPQQRAALQAAFARTYDQFVDRVHIGRGKHVKDISAVAQGRIFSGRQAVANGLADKIGGVETALDDLGADLKLKPGTYDVINLPGPESLPQFLGRFFGGVAAAPIGDASSASAMVQMARFTLGERTWRNAQPVLSGLLLMRQEPVLTLFPAALTIH